jgi:hypothetical protein
MLRALIFMLTLTVLVGIGIVKCNNDTKVAASAPIPAVDLTSGTLPDDSHLSDAAHEVNGSD